MGNIACTNNIPNVINGSNASGYDVTPVDDMHWDDATWILTCTFIIFTMQTGFGLLEAGNVAVKTQANIMYKNAVDVVFGGMSYWLFGYAFSFGDCEPYTNPFIGIGDFAVDSTKPSRMGILFATFVFQLSFATTATTIVSGAMAERTKLTGYIIFSFFNTFVYCVAAHWTWAANGFLNTMGLVDVAGSGAVHLTGGVSALIATLILRPRHGRFGPDQHRWKQPQPGNPTMVVLGTFLLWWGWLGFNCGSTFGVSGGLWILASKAAATTLNASAAGGVCGCILSYILHRGKYDVGDLCNSILGALVAITAPCAVVRPWEAVIIGAVGGILTVLSVYAFNLMKVDDPVSAISVHGTAAIWGLLSVGLFVRPDTGLPDQLNNGQLGLFYGGGGSSLGVQALACVCIIAWSALLTALILGVLHLTIGLRMSEEHELQGADMVEHGILPPTMPSHWKEVVTKEITAHINHGFEDDTLSNNSQSLPEVTANNKLSIDL